MNRKSLIVLLILVTAKCANSQKTEQVGVLPAIYKSTQYLSLLKDKNVAVVANKSSKIQDVNLIDTLFSLGIKVKAIFTPEHGFSGEYDAGHLVKNERYHAYPVPVFSLYGENKKPSVNQLENIDVVLFDLQDVGIRFFTYLSTLHYVMQACAELKIPLIVLDRPNPNVFYVDGPVMEAKYESYVGLHPIPVVYGMTIGEYAMMLNGEGWLGNNLKCNLKVIEISDYTHRTRYSLPERPSPNLPDMRSIYLYPSLCFFEGTILSVGRGTDFPFQVYGHPDYPIKDFSFIPKSIPGISKNPLYKGQKCYGVDLRGESIDSLSCQQGLDLSFLVDSYQQMNLGSSFFNNYFNYLSGTNKLKEQIIGGLSEEDIRKSWQPDLDNFKKIRVKYLLYPEK
jgi:uncharacterized protein YbbC (DUF1343 family)